MNFSGMFPPQLRTIQVQHPEFVLPGIVDYEGHPYKVISQDGSTYTCQELTVAELSEINQLVRHVRRYMQQDRHES